MTAQADALMGIFGFKRVEGDSMDKVSETRRALFNGALEKRQIDRDKSGLDALLRGEVSQAWWAFNAALDAVEIELPKERAKRKGFQRETLEDSAFNACRDLCVESIESTNLGLRIK